MHNRCRAVPSQPSHRSTPGAINQLGLTDETALQLTPPSPPGSPSVGPSAGEVGKELANAGMEAPIEKQAAVAGSVIGIGLVQSITDIMPCWSITAVAGTVARHIEVLR